MKAGWVLFDWGDTLMVDFEEYSGPMATWLHVEAVSHACETLEELRLRGWKIGLATNAGDSDESQIRSALAMVGLDELVDRVFCSAGVGHNKPTPEYFAHIESELGVTTDSLVMIGDNLGADVIGPNRLGIRAVWLSPDGRPAPEYRLRRTIGDLDELPALLESW